jgi:anaphase-promoting complex subunit 3
MAATVNSCADVLRCLVVQNLSLFLYDNAKFYAERLYYEDPRPENLHLLGQSYFRQGKIKQTYLILQNSDYATNRYLFALSCISLGKLNEAERALLSPVTAKIFLSKTVSLRDLESVPGGAAGLYLLGMVCRKEQRKDAAIDYFQKSLQLDPAMWGSINELSEMGIAGEIDCIPLFLKHFIACTDHLLLC